MTTLRKIANAALDLLFPPKCAACGREGAYLCDTCEPTLTVVNQQHWDKWRPARITALRYTHGEKPSSRHMYLF